MNKKQQQQQQKKPLGTSLKKEKLLRTKNKDSIPHINSDKTADLSTDTIETRRQKNSIFKVLK